MNCYFWLFRLKRLPTPDLVDFENVTPIVKRQNRGRATTTALKPNHHFITSVPMV